MESSRSISYANKCLYIQLYCCYEHPNGTCLYYLPRSRGFVNPLLPRIGYLCSTNMIGKYSKSSFIVLFLKHIDGLVQATLTPLLTHWSYCSFAPSHRYNSSENYLCCILFDLNVRSVYLIICFVYNVKLALTKKIGDTSGWIWSTIIFCIVWNSLPSSVRSWATCYPSCRPYC